MANREALRELQSRLAARLQHARTEVRQASWLALECAGQGLLVPLATAGEIFAVGTVKPVPHTQPWFLGVANLRGGLHGVVDLAAFLGLRVVSAGDTPRERPFTQRMRASSLRWRCTTSAVASVEPSLTTTTSQWAKVCWRTDHSVASSVAAALRAGMTTLTTTAVAGTRAVQEGREVMGCSWERR